jgi:arylsulfatase A-like enzyme
MKNIILIISDTFRYDNLFDRAAMPVRTPNLDAFSERAVSIEHMLVSSFPTIPHRTDLTSGRVGWPWYPWQDSLVSTKNHSGNVLGEAGYVRQLICDCPHLAPSNIDASFDACTVVRGQEGDIPLTRMNVMPPKKTRHDCYFRGKNLPDIARWTNGMWYRETDCFPPRTATLAAEWLEDNYKFNPFYLWVDFFDPHEPWDPPEYMVKRYDPGYKGTPMIHPNYGKASDMTKAELRNLRAHYCAEAELVDRWIGRIFQKLDDLQLWKNSVVMFTADHGMSLGEHNRTGKSNINRHDDRNWPLYPEIARIPFMVAAPGLKGGRSIDAIMQPQDILPTVLDLAGVKKRPPEPMHGISFASLLKGTSRKQPRDFAISAGFQRVRKGKKPSRATTPVVYTKTWAYAPCGPNCRRELYKLASDPLCEKNVIRGRPAQADMLHRLFVNWLKDVGAPEEALAPYTIVD